MLLIKIFYYLLMNLASSLFLLSSGEDEEDDPDFDPSKVKGGENPQECKQQ